MKHRIVHLGLAAGLSVFWVGASLATTRGAEMTERDALRHATTIVLGSFTGIQKEHTIKAILLDNSGKSYSNEIKFRAYSFSVREVLDGDKIPSTIEVNIIDPTQRPTDNISVVVGVARDVGSPNEGYLLVYGKHREVKTDSEMEAVRELVKKLRDVARITGDDPDTLRMQAVAPTPQGESAIPAAPRDQEIKGDPKHPTGK